MLKKRLIQHDYGELAEIKLMFKIDIFLKKDNPYSAEVFKRKRKENLDEEKADAEPASPLTSLLDPLTFTLRLPHAS